MDEGVGCTISLIHLCELDTLKLFLGSFLKAPAATLKVPVIIVWWGGVLWKQTCYTFGKQNFA